MASSLLEATEEKDVGKAYLDRSQFESLAAQNKAKAASSTLYVGQINVKTSEERIHALFSRFGVVRRIIMGLHRIERTPCGFCFVEFVDRQDALLAQKVLTGFKFGGNHIKVELDPGFRDGRQFARGRSGGQARQEFAQQRRGNRFNDNQRNRRGGGWGDRGRGDWDDQRGAGAWGNTISNIGGRYGGGWNNAGRGRQRDDDSRNGFGSRYNDNKGGYDNSSKRGRQDREDNTSSKRSKANQRAASDDDEEDAEVRERRERRQRRRERAGDSDSDSD